MKPKEVLILDYRTHSFEINKNAEKILNSAGISYVPNAKQEKYKPYNHKIAIFLTDPENTGEIEQIVKGNETSLPSRIIWSKNLDESQLKELTSFSDPLRINSTAWKIVRDQLKIRIGCIRKDAEFIRYNNFNWFGYKPKPGTTILKQDNEIDLINENFIFAKFPIPDKNGITPHAKGINILKKGVSYDYFDISNSFSYSKVPFSDIKKILRELSKKDSECFETVSFDESVLTNIGIVDERLQDFAINTLFRVNNDNADLNAEVSYAKLFEAMNIFMPVKQPKKGSRHIPDQPLKSDSLNIDLYNSDFSNYVDDNRVMSIKEAIEEWIKEYSSKLDYIIIHLGILEKMYSTDKVKLMEMFCDKFKPKCARTKIIIISGRGKPHNLPKGERFLNYSQVSQYISDGQSKHKLTDLCYSSRKLNNE